MIMFYNDYKSHFIKKTILAHVNKKAAMFALSNQCL